ncbi:MAG: DUF1972 domain-containing protein [Bacteroidetes bacterium]|nr:DUF1972 domain-containing protein [Bacteroidota bacterium]
MSRKKRIAIIGTAGIPARYGGFETLAEQLVRQLGDKYAITVYCPGPKYTKEERKTSFQSARLKYLPLQANGLQSIPYDSLSILHALFSADVLLVLGVAGAWLLPFVKLFTRKKIIVSIDGIEWKRAKWNRLAKCYLWWAEKMAVKYSHADISDNESIQDYTAVRYTSLSHIIEYGADHTVQVTPTAKDKEEYPFLHKPYAFKVCRIEPENNIHLVLEAFATMPGYTLVMIGNWKNSEYGSSLYLQYSGYNNIILMDPVYDQRKLDVIRGNAYLYVHGHSAGGTNPSLVEAMYLGLPVLAFDVSYNRTTTEGKACYFKTAADIAAIIGNTRLAVLRENGFRMKEIAHRRYTWEVVARKYDELVQRVLNNKGKIPVTPSVATIPAEQLISYELAHLQAPTPFYEKR